jgi:hypothetical protein
VIVVPDHRGFRIEITAQLVEGAWTAGVRIRRTLSDTKPHVEQVTCREASAMEVWVPEKTRSVFPEPAGPPNPVSNPLQVSERAPEAQTCIRCQDLLERQG